MTKLLKISGRILGLTSEWLLILFILFAFVIRTSVVQTFFAQKTAEYLSAELNAEISIDRVSIVFFDEVAFDNLLIKDQQGDTMIFAKSTFAVLGDINFSKKTYTVKKASLDHALVHLSRDKNGLGNYQFLIDHFKSDKKKEKSKVQFGITDVELTNSHFRYDDNRKERKSKGVDFWHIDAKVEKAKVSNLAFSSGSYKGKIETFKGTEKSGLKIKNIIASAHVTPTKMHLKDVQIFTERSTLASSDFKLLTHDFQDYLTFVDSVTFDAKILASHVNLYEASLFAPILTGMQHDIEIKGELSNKTKNLYISNVDLRFGTTSHLQGNFLIPDYRSPDISFLQERITSGYISILDLENLHLPNSFTKPHFELNPKIKRLGHIVAQNLTLDGFISNFVITADKFETGLGVAYFDTGLQFEKVDSNMYSFHSPNGAGVNYDFRAENFDIGRFIGDEKVGSITGKFWMEGTTSSIDDIVFSSLKGEVDQFNYYGHEYNGITIHRGNFIGNKFDGNISIKDDALDMTYEGTIDFNGSQSMKFNLEITEALLDKMNLTTLETKLESHVIIDLQNISSDGYSGTVELEDLFLETRENPKTEQTRKFNIDKLVVEVTRSKEFGDAFDLKSTIGDGRIEGDINFGNIVVDIEQQLARVFPSLFKEKINKHKNDSKPDDFTFKFQVKSDSINDLLGVFYPDIKQIDPRTLIKGSFDGQKSILDLHINSKRINYQDYIFQNFNLRQTMDSVSMNGLAKAEEIFINDSLSFQDVKLVNSGTNNRVVVRLSWEENTPTESLISWTTNIEDSEHYNLVLDPSYFHIRDHRWDIHNESRLTFEGDTIHVDNFKLERGIQYLSIDGQVSDQDKHRLNFEMHDFEISEIAEFVTSDYSLKGTLNGWGFISNPFNDLYYLGDASLVGLEVNNRQIGDVWLQSNWDKPKQSVTLMGDLIYKNLEALQFEGDYFLKKEEDNLDIDFDFDMMDIQFVNAFMNPEVLNDIKGKLQGKVNVTGKPTEPILEGEVNLISGSAMVDFLGTHFTVDGPIEIDEFGFYMNSIPVYDEDGNAGSLVGSVFHRNFKNFNFDLQFDLEDDAVNKDPDQPWKPVKLDRFLIMKTPYDPEFSYYGKGYATGIANIFGYADNLEITVDLTTQEGSWLNIPMYGIGEIDEEQNFIIFKDDLENQDSVVQKFDLLGVDLDLQIKVTEETPVKIVFNEELGDIIEANGHGDINLKVDNFGHISMEGTYEVDKGVYNFAMQPVKGSLAVKQKFHIEQGGTITWTGDPYDATLNLKSYYKTNANIADISSDQLGSNRGGHQDVLCYMNLTESLLKPTIEFDIQAPNADSDSKILLERIKSDQDELNKQFFSLLLTRKFMPLTGTATANGSAALELVANQINSMLSQISSDYKLNVALDRNAISGDDTYEFGVTKGFLDGRLLISGSFGIENRKIGDHQSQQNFIGDVYVEYVLNEDGTVRINLFNESTDKTIIYDVETGLFTQGAGLKYKEDFNNGREIQLFRNFFDLFRKNENKRNTDKFERIDAFKSKDIKSEDEILAYANH